MLLDGGEDEMWKRKSCKFFMKETVFRLNKARWNEINCNNGFRVVFHDDITLGARTFCSALIDSGQETIELFNEVFVNGPFC